MDITSERSQVIFETAQKNDTPMRRLSSILAYGALSTLTEYFFPCQG
jgi:hypothetical protein